MELEKIEQTPIEEKNQEEEFYDNTLTEYAESHKEKLKLLNKLPAPIIQSSHNDFDKQFEVYLKLSKDAKPQEDSYFVSAYKTSIANKKEYLFPEEIIEKMTKIYNIDEYGSNLAQDIYDPKLMSQDSNNFYENLAKKQLEIYSGGNPNLKPNPNFVNTGKKTFWDAGPGSYVEPARITQPPLTNQIYPNMYSIPNPLMMGQNSYEQLNSLAMNPLALIARQNKAFVEKNK